MLPLFCLFTLLRDNILTYILTFLFLARVEPPHIEDDLKMVQFSVDTETNEIKMRLISGGVEKLTMIKWKYLAI